ncbi:phosphatidylinositol-3-phosphate binding protein NDAI_0C04380 [Naumovozyma dairenensis CBS 421]|uniref:FYVE-type domain-containing protein n=1 Tax=Naumovozyma dairenensis (strain ATCC 10597 / BCRC 20456 / CBS 421 / NBRC 0211 / NRRL Y-12639) TaxID=1071378 RepID=G0W8I7_NAUDC|nr:hypothetical protein NDAI_0C04380 [Naumovozyma dairenensis CBS 421]CCD24098.1 hypothetical protein NDAI_0C04380 [Naumovozyma dairenensis CBS 421]
MSTVGSANSSSRTSIVNAFDLIVCPICSKEFHNLQNLNNHLDVDHNLADHANTTSPSIPTNGLGETPKKKRGIKRSHWKTPRRDKDNLCHDCGGTLTKPTGMVNCPKCGELYCKRHCKNIMKLNLDAEYDVNNGSWYNCCYACFSSRPGYNDFGASVDLTFKFEKLRSSKSEDKRLRLLQLENRLVRLIDGIISIYENYKGSLLMQFRMNTAIFNFECSVAPWKDDLATTECNICGQKFTVLLRKHHCRLCGNVVCDDESTNCSTNIPITSLIQQAQNLPFQKANATDLSDADLKLRICRQCIETVFIGRKFALDIQAAKSAILQKYESISNLSGAIVASLPEFMSLLRKIEGNKEENELSNENDLRNLSKLREKLLKLFATYSTLNRQINACYPKNNSERRIQEAIQITASQFINDNVLPLKAIPSALNPAAYDARQDQNFGESKKLSSVLNKLTIKEVKEYREELMVLKEQIFILEESLTNAKIQRKFDEVTILHTNLKELNDRVKEIQDMLGDEGFL